MKWLVLTASMLGLLSAAADCALVDFEKGLLFPQELGGMPCEQSEKYNNESFGYTVFYGLGDSFSAEVSILPLGRTDIGSGPSADGVDVVLDSVDAMLKRQDEQGEISGVRKRGSVIVPKDGKLQFVNAVYQFSEPRVEEGLTNAVPRIASVYATAAHENFVKVIFRFDFTENDKARAMAERLVQQLVEILTAQPSAEDLLLAACDAAVYNPSDYGGRVAAQAVFQKAQEMGELNVYDAFFVWPQGYSKPKNADLLLAAYFAGMLKTILPQGLESGGEFEAFTSMLTAYDAMRERDDIESIDRLDTWSKAEDKAALYQKLLIEFEYAAPE